MNGWLGKRESSWNGQQRRSNRCIIGAPKVLETGTEVRENLNLHIERTHQLLGKIHLEWWTLRQTLVKLY